MTSLRIAPLPGYAPTIGRLVGMLTYARHTLHAAVDGLSRDALDHLHDARSNFHVAEDEISHRGQIRWLRARLHSEHAPVGG